MQHPSSFASDTLKVPGDGLLGDYMLYLLRVAYTKCSAQLYPELMDKHGIAPEEWRTLTLLGDTGQAESEYLAQMVGQPIDVFDETIERMQRKDYINISQDGHVELTANGHTMAKCLFEIAKTQEEIMLADLSEQQRSELKQGLKHVAGLVAN